MNESLNINNFSIIIPLLNEEQNLKKLFKEISLSLVNYQNFYEIIAVDDGSTDNTHLLLKEIKNQFDNEVKIIRNKSNKGQSYSLRIGIENASFNTIVTIDGDCQNNPKDILKLLKIYFKENKYSLVGGIRKHRKDGTVKKISSKLANFVRRLYLNDNCGDTGCSLKVFEKNIFLMFPYFDGIHRFLPALFLGCGKKTFFVPVSHRPRVYGYSKYKTVKRLRQGIFDMIKVNKIIKEFNKNDF